MTKKERDRADYLKNRVKRLAYAVNYRKNNPEKVRALALRAKYGVTELDYLRLLAAQDGSCANLACRTKPDSKALHLDHDHVTGKVRGLLCNRCNLALGLVADSPEVLQGLIFYLESAQ